MGLRAAEVGGGERPEPSIDTPGLARVVAATPTPSAMPSMPAATSSARAIEIMIGDCIVRVIGEVEAAALTAVLRAVRRAS
jgi:hypothetical protein